MLNCMPTTFLEQPNLDAHLNDVIHCNRKLCVKHAGLGLQAHLLAEKNHRKQNENSEGPRSRIIE